MARARQAGRGRGVARGRRVARGSGERDVRTCQGGACGADVVRGTRVIGTHTHALRARAHMRIYARAHTYARAYAHRGHTGAGEGTPYNIQMAACGSGSDTECVLGLFGNGVTLFSNPNRQ